ncbi:unnamed protein product, partial [Tetraodon nigroviridis]
MEARLFLLPLVCLWLLHLRVSADSTCKLKAKFNLSGYKSVEKKTVVVGGMFPVHMRVASSGRNTSRVPVSSGCEGFNFRTFRWTRTMLFAIDEINRRSDLLPDTDLGYVIYDSCFTISKAVEGTLTYLTGQDEAVPNYRCGSGPPLAALVGAGGTDLSIATARILGLYHFPQLLLHLLGSGEQIPVPHLPEDRSQRPAPVQRHRQTGDRLRLDLGGDISANDDYGKYGIKDFKEQVEEAGVCISFSETLPKGNSPEDIQRIVQTVVESTAKIIVVFSSDVDLSPLVAELLRNNVTNRTWIASEAWVTSALLLEPGASSLLGGTLGFAVRRGSIPGLQRYLLDLDPYGDPLTEEFWETVGVSPPTCISFSGAHACLPQVFNCTLDYGKALRQSGQGLCSGLESLAQLNNTYSDISQLRITYSVYKAVYAVAHALHNLEHCQQGQGPFNGKDCADIGSFEPWQFSSDGEISYVRVGHFNASAAPEEQMSISNSSILWNNDTPEPPRSVCSDNCQPGTRKGIRQGEPVCCFDCIPCADGEISNTTNARECILCGEDDWSNQAHDACVPKIIEFLAFGEPLGITLIVISACGAVVTIAVAVSFTHQEAGLQVVFILNASTPLVKANDAVLSLLLLFSLVVTFLCSIVFLGEPQDWSCMTSQVALALGFALCLSCIMSESWHPCVCVCCSLARSCRREIWRCFLIPQAVACTVWLVLFPPHAVKNTSAQNIKIILECDEGSIVFICCIFAYDILLALIAFIFAFIARKLEDHFSEGKSMTFGMLVFFIVWISFVPAYLSTRGKFMVAVQIFAILASSFGLLTCIFLPKCYILLIKPERNKEDMMRP